MALVTDLQKHPHFYNLNGDKSVLSTLSLAESSAKNIQLAASQLE